MPTKIKKRDGTTEDYTESKIVTGVKKAGATAEQAVRVSREVTQKLAGKAFVTAEELSGMVISTLALINKNASEAFAKFRDAKVKTKKK
jgi:transcriptional regulator NrdR family protein